MKPGTKILLEEIASLILAVFATVAVAGLAWVLSEVRR